MLFTDDFPASWQLQHLHVGELGRSLFCASLLLPWLYFGLFFAKKHLLFGFGESMPLLGFEVFEYGRKTKAFSLRKISDEDLQEQ